MTIAKAKSGAIVGAGALRAIGLVGGAIGIPYGAGDRLSMKSLRSSCNPCVIRLIRSRKYYNELARVKSGAIELCLPYSHL